MILPSIQRWSLERQSAPTKVIIATASATIIMRRGGVWTVGACVAKKRNDPKSQQTKPGRRLRKATIVMRTRRLAAIDGRRLLRSWKRGGNQI